MLVHDTAVPQRDRLLDTSRVAVALTKHLGTPVRHCYIGHVSYRPGRRLRLVYRVLTNDPHGRIAVRHVAVKTLDARKSRTMPEGAHHGVHYLPELAATCWTFPYDRRLEHLPAVAEARAALTHSVDKRWVRSRLVDYNPGVSAVLACLNAESQIIAYARVNAGDEGERMLRIQNILTRLAKQTAGRLEVARALAYVNQYRTLVVEPISGKQVGRLNNSELLTALESYGETLAVLHTLPLAELGTTGRDTLSRLTHRADGIGLVRPDLADTINDLIDELRARWPDAGADTGVVHGDVNENNAIRRGGQIVLIDFERTGSGPTAADLGNFLALLRYFRSRRLISARDERLRADAFLRGYRRIRPLPDPQTLRVHESAALAERAFRAVARLRPAALPLVPALLSEAKGLLR